MSFRNSHAALTSLANSFSRLVRLRQRKRSQAKRVARKRFLEQLEPRNLMALNIVSLSPVDGAVGTSAPSEASADAAEEVNGFGAVADCAPAPYDV